MLVVCVVIHYEPELWSVEQERGFDQLHCSCGQLVKWEDQPQVAGQATAGSYAHVCSCGMPIYAPRVHRVESVVWLCMVQVGAYHFHIEHRFEAVGSVIVSSILDIRFGIHGVAHA